MVVIYARVAMFYLVGMYITAVWADTNIDLLWPRIWVRRFRQRPRNAQSRNAQSRNAQSRNTQSRHH